MAEEIEFENRHFWNFKSHVITLTTVPIYAATPPDETSRHER